MIGLCQDLLQRLEKEMAVIAVRRPMVDLEGKGQDDVALPLLKSAPDKHGAKEV